MIKRLDEVANIRRGRTCRKNEENKDIAFKNEILLMTMGACAGDLILLEEDTIINHTKVIINTKDESIISNKQLIKQLHNTKWLELITDKIIPQIPLKRIKEIGINIGL